MERRAFLQEVITDQSEDTALRKHGSFIADGTVLESEHQYPMEVSIDSSSGQVTVRYTNDGKEKVATDRLQLPSDLANGMISRY